MQRFHGKLDTLWDRLGPVDLFICCASFEERCLSIARRAGASSVKSAIVVRHKDGPASVREHFDLLREHFPNRDRAVQVDRFDPTGIADKFYDAIEASVSSAASIAVDITTFTHEALLILFRILEVEFAAERRIILLYSTAEDYSVGDSTSQKWLSRGVRDIRSVLGYPGVMSPRLPYHLIVLTGIEHERTQELVSQYEPTMLSIGGADTAEEATRPHYDVHKHQCELLMGLVENAREFSFKAFDPAACCDALINACDAVPEHNVVIAPMNTKLSTIGAALAVRQRPEVQLCYASVAIYNYAGYSAPGDEYVMLEWR